MFIAHIPDSILRPGRIAKSIAAGLAIAVLLFLIVRTPTPGASGDPGFVSPPATAENAAQAGQVFVPTTVVIESRDDGPPPPTF